jgi:hypothetical protein
MYGIYTVYQRAQNIVPPSTARGARPRRELSAAHPRNNDGACGRLKRFVTTAANVPPS